MFVLETSNAKAARIMSFLMAVVLLLTGSFGALLTLHIYVSRRDLSRRGLES